ncbi:putative RING-H2 finger protein ATL19 [Humulus lupulus]|uniref:putative RING-H2 finger protein ATL19 n=1 Tax=Humulus lupulus TaxID=3486 RepID=UPI002B41177F|nr:putative RING-H2 finger protein ATL19 [Humulus lupulus]
MKELLDGFNDFWQQLTWTNTKQSSSQNQILNVSSFAAQPKHSNIIMAPPSPQTTPPLIFISPSITTTLFYILTGFVILLVIFACIVAFSIMVSLIIVSIVHSCFEFFNEVRQNDLEAGNTSRESTQDFHRTSGAQRGNYEHLMLENNVQVLEMLERILRHLGEGRDGTWRHRRALEKLPPCVIYGSHSTELKPSSCSSSSSSGDNDNNECAICLEDFEKGDSCQVFPVCNHIFHSICIGNWLRKNPTCPLCRHCLLRI